MPRSASPAGRTSKEHGSSRPKTEAAQGGGSGSKLTSSGSEQARNAASLTDAQSETREQLYFRAAALGINGRSRMTKDRLREAIERREAEERHPSSRTRARTT